MPLLSLFLTVAEALELEPTLLGHCDRLRIYREVKDSGQWLDREAAPAEAALSQHLEGARMSRDIDVDAADPKKLCVYVETLDAVMFASFRNAPPPIVVKGFQASLDKAVRYETMQFRALHNDLTGLPNREMFDQELRAALGPWLPAQGAISAGTGATNMPEREPRPVPRQPVWLFAFDIDRFKQINDSYDHQHGNIVLHAFGRRVKAEVESIASDYPGVHFTLAHPSGEEFFILAVGKLDDAEAETIAERVRICVKDTPLPSDKEWTLLSAHHGKPNVAPPPARERNMTVSIGFASHRSLQHDGSVLSGAGAAGKLKEFAEDALHRAKSGGRDAVCNFGKIKERYGSVLEHNVVTDLVVIDIGRRVDVVASMHFDVFHPDFAGPRRVGEDRPYFFEDGRTQKKIGAYPEWKSGTIEVAEVQDSIAFCTVTERTNQLPFEKGYRLKYRQSAADGAVEPRTTSPGDGGTSSISPPTVSKDVSASGRKAKKSGPRKMRTEKTVSENALVQYGETEGETRTGESPQAETEEESLPFLRTSPPRRLIRHLSSIPGDVRSFIDKETKTGRSVGCVVVALSNPREIFLARGAQYAERTIVRLIRAAELVASYSLLAREIRSYTISRQPEEFLVFLCVVPRNLEDSGDAIGQFTQRILDYATAETGGVRLFRAGYFDPALLSAKHRDSVVSDASLLKAEAAPEYSLTALESIRQRDGEVLGFSPAIAVEVFERATTSAKTTAKDVEALYETFRKLGIDVGELHLAAAAAMWQLSRGNDSTFESFKLAASRAKHLLPKDPRVLRTTALSAFISGDVDEAFQDYDSVVVFAGPEGLEGSPGLAYAVLLEVAHRDLASAKRSELFRALKVLATQSSGGPLAELLTKPLEDLAAEHARTLAIGRRT